MKLAHIALAAATLVAGTSAFAGTITGSSNIEFLAFDGQKIKKNTALNVNDNHQHQVVVEVAGIYRAGADETFFESSPIILTFAGSNENIKITAPDLRSESDVAKFKKSPTFKIETASGKAIDFKQDVLKGEGFLPNSNISENLANYNAGDNKASVKALATTAIPTAITGAGKASKGKVMVQGENIAEQQLQYWFQQADKETQKRFLDWAKKQ